MHPKLVEGLYTYHADQRILYFNPVPPDWITINERYECIFDCFDGEHSQDAIEDLIQSHYGDGSSILIRQIRDFIETSRLFDHNLGGSDNHRGPPEALNALPKYVYLTLTDSCNLRCRYCYAVERQGFSDARVENWVQYIKDVLSISKRPVFIFTGGEPLLVPYIYDLADMTKRRGCENILLTNGTQIDSQEKAGRVASLFSLVKISLDTLDETVSASLRGPGVTAKVQRAFDLLNDRKVNVQILATVTSLTKDSLEGFAKHFGDQVSFQPLYTMGRGRRRGELSITGKEYYEALTETSVFRLLPGFHRNIHNYRNRPFKRCAMALEEISIDSRGSVFPCHMLHYDELNCGNLKDDGFEAIYNNSPILKNLRKLNVDNIEQCVKCVFRNICGGACRARVDIPNNGVAGFNEFCEFEKSAILDALLYSFG